MRVCAFLASSDGHDDRYRQAAQQFGTALAQRGVGLVYGGGHVGLMGVVADAALAGGGTVHGVIPQHLVDREMAHEGPINLQIVPDMHTRKAAMAKLSDAFVALPGGLGTLEELFEVLTWQQIGLHAKPIALLNVGGFWDGLLTVLRTQVQQGFTAQRSLDRLIVASEPQALLDRLESDAGMVAGS